MKQQLRVLIADDHPDVAESLAMLIHTLGHETYVVGDSHSVATCLDTFHPDVLILELRLPGINGLEVAQAARAGSDALTIIAHTTSYAVDLRLQSVAAGVDYYLLKPADPDVWDMLLALVRGTSDVRACATTPFPLLKPEPAHSGT